MTTEEKRKYERIDSLNLSYVLTDAKPDDAEKQTMGRTLNVSEAGILLETHLAVDVGQKMLLSIGLEDEVVDFKGKVVHSKLTADGTHELGVEFLDMNETTFAKLEKFVQTFRRHHQASPDS